MSSAVALFVAAVLVSCQQYFPPDTCHVSVGSPNATHQLFSVSGAAPTVVTSPVLPPLAFGPGPATLDPTVPRDSTIDDVFRLAPEVQWLAVPSSTGAVTVGRGRPVYQSWLFANLSNTNTSELYTHTVTTMEPTTLSVSFRVIPGGNHTVVLYAFEPNPQANVGSRVFDVVVNGRRCASNVDLYAQAGNRTKVATQLSCNVIDSDGVIDVTLASVVGRPLLSAVHILRL